MAGDRGRTPPAPGDAAFLQIDLELLQPAPGDSVGGFNEDLDGSVWFDDVGITLRPRVVLGVSVPGGVTRSGSAPELIFSARDLAGDALHVSIRVFDLDGREVASTTFDADASGRERRWQPPIKRMGWYRAIATVSSGGAVVAQASHDLVVLGERSSGGSAAGLIADPTQGLDTLPALARGLMLGTVVLPAWGDDTSAATIHARIERLASDRKSVV